MGHSLPLENLTHPALGFSQSMESPQPPLSSRHGSRRSDVDFFDTHAAQVDEPGTYAERIHSVLDHKWLAYMYQDHTTHIPANVPLIPTYGLSVLEKSWYLQSFIVIGLIRCLLSSMLAAGFCIAIGKYQGFVLNPLEKSVFEAIIVALSLALGLNIASALKETAIHMRWWFLSMKKRPFKEVALPPTV